ncbi:MAG: GIY-YIG nuclease family protein [Planctomycetes bacterium]|nr:GIY-YIG nuclease family protein [Planctomycetota bacterium]
MFTVYVLQDEKNRFYKGMTNNLLRRLSEHKCGKTKTTRNMKIIKVVYTEEYNDKIEAHKRELYLKSAAGRRFIKKMLGG